MIVSTSTTATPDRATSSSATRPASDRDAESASNGSPDFAVVPFDIVLKATGVLPNSAGGAVDTKLSPSLMFEPATTQGGPGSRSGSEAGDPFVEDRHDRTSVSSRRARAGSQRNAAQSRDSESNNLATIRSATARDGAAAGRLSFDETASSVSRAGMGNDYAALRSVAKSQTGPESSVVASAASSVTAASSPVARIPSGAESVRAPAMMVGRVLAMGQSGEADGSRSGAQNGASGSTTGGLSAKSGDTSASRSPTAQETDGQHLEAGRSAGRAKASAFEQMVQSIRMSTDGHKSSVRLQLNPPELGRMDVDVEVVGDRVRINVKTQSDSARLVLQDRVSELVASLEDRGISVERIDVVAEFLGEGPGEPSGQSTPDSTVEGGWKQFSEDSHSDPSASEDASSRPVEPGGESESAVVAESRLDIRV